MPKIDDLRVAAHHRLADKLRKAARLLDQSADVAEANPFCEDAATFLDHVEPLMEADVLMRSVIEACRPTLRLLVDQSLRQQKEGRS